MASSWPALSGAGAHPPPIGLDRAIYGKVQGDSNDYRWLATTDTLLERNDQLARDLDLAKAHCQHPGLYWRPLPEGRYAAMVVTPSWVYDAANRPAGVQRRVRLWTAGQQPAPALAALAMLGQIARLGEEAIWEAQPAAFWEDLSNVHTFEPDVITPPAVGSPPFDDLLQRAREHLGRALGEHRLAMIYQGLLNPGGPPVMVPLEEPLPPEALACIMLPLPRERADNLSFIGALLPHKTWSEQLHDKWDLAFYLDDGGAVPEATTEPNNVARSMAQALLNADPGLIEARVEEDDPSAPALEVMALSEKELSPAQPVRSLKEIESWWYDNDEKLKYADQPEEPVDMAPLALKKLYYDDLKSEQNLEYLRSMPGWREALLENLCYPLERYPGQAKDLIRESFTWRDGVEWQGDEDEAYCTWLREAMGRILEVFRNEEITLNHIELDRGLMRQLNVQEPHLWAQWMAELSRFHAGAHLMQEQRQELMHYAEQLTWLQEILKFIFSDDFILGVDYISMSPHISVSQPQPPALEPYPMEKRPWILELFVELHQLLLGMAGQYASSRAASFRALVYVLLPDRETVAALKLEHDQLVSPLMFMPYVNPMDGESLKGLGSRFLNTALQMLENSTHTTDVSDAVPQFTQWANLWQQEEEGQNDLTRQHSKAPLVNAPVAELQRPPDPMSTQMNPSDLDQTQVQELAAYLVGLLDRIPDDRVMLVGIRQEINSALIKACHIRNAEEMGQLQHKIRRLQDLLSGVS